MPKEVHNFIFELDRPLDLNLNPCITCGACCSDTMIGVTVEERQLLESAGAVLKFKKTKDPRAPKGAGWATIHGDCPFLERTEDGKTPCKIYESENQKRPGGCAVLEAGSYECEMFRARAGLESLRKPFIATCVKHTVAIVCDE